MQLNRGLISYKILENLLFAKKPQFKFHKISYKYMYKIEMQDIILAKLMFKGKKKIGDSPHKRKRIIDAN